MTIREKLILSFTILCLWTVFLFSDAISSVQYKKQNTNPPVSVNNDRTTSLQKGGISDNHWSASSFDSQSQHIETQNKASKLEETIAENIENWLNDLKIKTNEIKNLSQDIAILEKIYEQEKSPDILKLLLEKLNHEYQFEKAKEYIWNINIFQDKSVDPKTYIYTYINTLSLTDQNSMSKFMTFIDQIREHSMISADDYVFYQWLTKLWQKDYEWADILLKQVKWEFYQSFTNQIFDTIDKFNSQKWTPLYYKDSLIALTAMKNGYFSLANKLAVDSIIEDNQYILPYQILAYSNFLTNNREKSIENFYELVKLDSENQDKYNFYIWVSYYRWWNHRESILILSHLMDNEAYKTECYRYLISNYQALWDDSKTIQVRKKLLWQDDLSKSDFKNFYDIVFYRPLSEWKNHSIYKQERQLSYDFVGMCYDQFGTSEAICLYWEVGMDIANKNRENVENSLLYLADNYPESSIFQALGDYYTSHNSSKKAKTYYLKAVSLSDNTSQKNIIENKIISELD